MGLKQIKDVDRIVFLRMFVEQMLLSSAIKYKSAKVIEEEKIKRKILEPFPEKIPIFHFPNLEKIGKKEFGMRREVARKNIGVLKKDFLRKEPIHLTNPKKSIEPLKRPVAPPVVFNSNISGIEKIKKLLRDFAIQSIECPGPGKYLIVKKRNKISLTRLVLSPEDINNVIENYSKESRIPVVGGILRAVVGDIFISAVSSQFVGSRFIITRKTPYSLISNVKPLPK